MNEVTDVAGDAMIVAGMIEALKRAGLPSQFAGIAAVVLGVAWCVLDAGELSSAATLRGMITGLSASGFYEAGKQLNERNPLKPAGSADNATSRNSTVTEVPEHA